eukprot:TRINITY_DN1913_c0_g1_i1.p1 TRINITY_DN1913_c0_g1~~TRINITY_DN1913_c0_g1_i1.p1  ORF type:complete len:396 (+),score=117.16 TRINITY_DN1913_c0_g1_i1:110-1297(+)
MAEIYFYRAGDDYGCFSNFSRHKIHLNEKSWPTTEHYFQAMKFVGTVHEDEVRLAKGPKEAASLGRDRSKPLRQDWEQVKDSIMKEALIAKFTQHKDLRAILLQTGSANLIEHTANDSYWADGGDGSGKNRLGELLMEVRSELAKSPSPSADGTQTSKSEDVSEEESEEESGSGDSEESQEGEAEGQQSASSSTRVRRPRKSKHDQMIKKLTNGRRKAKAKRGAFIDEQGNATMEKNNEQKGSVNLVGKNSEVTFSEKALPAHAKIVLHRNQFRRKYQPTEEDFEDDDMEEEEPSNEQAKSSYSLGDFISSSAEGQLAEEPVSVYLMSASECIEAAKNTVEMLQALPKNDPAIETLMRRCKEIKSALEELIPRTEQEDVLQRLLEQFDRVSAATL